MSELLPCPFCGQVPTIYGAKVKEYASGKWASKSHDKYWIHPRCILGCIFGTAHVNAYGATGGIEFVSEEAAIEFWNTRAERTCQLITTNTEAGYGKYCSECETRFHIEAVFNYCPNCGAKVIEEQ